MSKITVSFVCLLLVCGGFLNLAADDLHVLYTVDGTQYVGKMVDYKYETIFFNVYKLGKVDSTLRIPLNKIWKIEFTTQAPQNMQSSFELEQKYQKFRKNKQSRSFDLPANKPWIDTGLTLRVGQEVMFSSTGSIAIDSKTMVFQDGELNLNWDKNKAMPTQPTGAIIARIGNDGPLFYVGNNRAPIMVTIPGTLFIGINDFNFTDNTGFFKVTVYY